MPRARMASTAASSQRRRDAAAARLLGREDRADAAGRHRPTGDAQEAREDLHARDEPAIVLRHPEVVVAIGRIAFDVAAEEVAAPPAVAERPLVEQREDGLALVASQRADHDVPQCGPREIIGGCP
jgi:hypothetical protein